MQLRKHYLKGGLFESFIMSELHKMYFNQGRLAPLYFWRDRHGHEVDCIIDRAGELFAVEVKAGKTISTSFFDGLSYWNELTQSDPKFGTVIYADDTVQKGSKGRIISWKQLDEVEQGLL